MLNQPQMTDQLQEIHAFDEGSFARKNGKDTLSCPYTRDNLRFAWLRGWRSYFPQP